MVTLTGDTDPLKGRVFLVIDGDGQTGYAAGADYVIDITGSTADPSLIHFTGTEPSFFFSTSPLWGGRNLVA